MESSPQAAPLIRADGQFSYSIKTIESVLASLGPSGRVKYSCVDVGISIVVFGANTGSVYFFDRASLNFLKLFSSPELQEGLSLLKLSPAERFLALVVGKGTIYVAEMALKAKERIVVKVTDHKDAEITAIHWTDPFTLISADETGAVYLSYIPRASKLFFQAELLYRTDSRVVQLDSVESRLAVSSLTRAVVLDLAKKTSQAVGTKLREGRFGACFHSGAGAQVIFCARPGKRIWVADSVSGKVLSTLSFSSAIPAAASSNFSKLLPLANVLLACDDNTAAFVVDVNTVETLAEFPLAGPIHAIAAWECEAYVLHGPARSVTRLVAENPHITARRLLEQGNLSGAVEIALKFRSTKVQHPEVVEMLRTLAERAAIASMPADRVTALKSLVTEAQLQLEEHRAAQLLEEQRRKQKEEEDRAEQLRLQQQRQTEEEEQRAALMERLRNAPRPPSPTPHAQFSVPFLPTVSGSDLIASVPGASVLSTSQMAPSIPIEGTGTASSVLRASSTNVSASGADPGVDSATDSKKRPKVRKMRTIDFNSSAAPVITTTTKLLPTPTAAPTSVPPPPPAVAAASAPSQTASGSDTEPESAPTAVAAAPIRTSSSSPLTTSFGGTSPVHQPAAAIPSVAPPSTGLSFLDVLPTAVSDTATPATPPLPLPAGTTSAPIQFSSKPPAAVVSQSPVSSGSSSVGGTPRQSAEPTTPNQISRTVSPALPAAAPTATTVPAAVPQQQTSRPVSPMPARGPLVDIRDSSNATQSAITRATSLEAPKGPTPASTAAPPQQQQPTALSNTSASAAASSAWSLAKKVMGNIAGATVPPVLKQSLSLDDLRTSTPPVATSGPASAIPNSVQQQTELAAPGEADPLTRAAYEALQRSRKTGGSVSALKTLLSHWLVGFDPSKPPPYTPQLWLQEILTALFEINASERWSSEAAFEFLTKYGAFVHAPTAALICNEQHWKTCLQVLMDRENKELDTLCNALEKLLSTPPNEPGSGGPRPVLEQLKAKRNILLTLKFLKRLLEAAPKETIAYCVSAYPQVQPWNVDEARYRNDSGLALYLEYLEQLMAAHEEPHNDSTLVARWFEYCLQHGSPSREALFDSDGNPHRDSHKLTWRHVITLRNVLVNPRLYRYSKAELLEKCQKAGFFAGVLLLLPRGTEALELTLRLDDLIFFRQIAADVEQTSHWQSVMQLAIQLRRQSGSLPRAITKEEIIASMAIALGAASTVQLLLTAPEFVSDVDTRVYGSLLVSFRAAKKEQKLVHDMLELIDSYLWAQKPLTTAPQIRALREAEINDSPLSTVSFLNTSSSASSSSGSVLSVSGEPTLRFDYGGKPLPRYFLEYRSHWGVAVDLLTGSCPVCTLSFTDGSAGELSIFPCGHAFHQMCAPEEACKLCYDSQLNATPLYQGQSE